MLQTERTRWSAFGGLVGAREKYSSTTNQSQTTDVSAITGLDFLTFRFTTTDIRSRFILYPSLNDTWSPADASHFGSAHKTR